jgi:phosphatidylinositol alpha-mannosyltransferase
VLLGAFKTVKAAAPQAELWIVGSNRPADIGDVEGVKWLGQVDRERLLRDIMPSFDVFAYPTPHDCFSYVMLEAMAAGCAIATSDYVSMPEAVDYGRAGLISPVGDSKKLAENIITLLNPQTNLHFRLAARARFTEYFSNDAVVPKLLQAYQSALAAAAMAKGRPFI